MGKRDNNLNINASFRNDSPCHFLSIFCSLFHFLSLISRFKTFLILCSFCHLTSLSLSPSFCGVANSSSPPSFSAVQRYPFFFRMLQIRIPSRPITQKTGTKANTAYSAVFSSALRTTVPLTGPPALLDGPLPTVRTVLTCIAAERGDKDKKKEIREMQDV